MIARRSIATVERADLLVGLDRGLDVAELRLTEPCHFEKLLLLGLDRDRRVPDRAHQDVAQVGVLPFLTQIILDPGQSFGVDRIERETFFVLGEGLCLFALAGEGFCGFENPGKLVQAAAPRRAGLASRGATACEAVGPSWRRHARRGNRGQIEARGLSARIFDEGAIWVRFQILGPERLDVVRAPERTSIVGGQLHRAIVPGNRFERGRGVGVAVLAVVRLRQRDEDVRGLVAFWPGDRFPTLQALQNRGTELLRESGVILVERTRVAKGGRRAGAIAGNRTTKRRLRSLEPSICCFCIAFKQPQCLTNDTCSANEPIRLLRAKPPLLLPSSQGSGRDPDKIKSFFPWKMRLSNKTLQ